MSAEDWKWRMELRDYSPEIRPEQDMNGEIAMENSTWANETKWWKGCCATRIRGRKSEWFSFWCKCIRWQKAEAAKEVISSYQAISSHYLMKVGPSVDRFVGLSVRNQLFSVIAYIRLMPCIPPLQCRTMLNGIGLVKTKSKLCKFLYLFILSGSEVTLWERLPVSPSIGPSLRPSVNRNGWTCPPTVSLCPDWKDWK